MKAYFESEKQKIINEYNQKKADKKVELKLSLQPIDNIMLSDGAITCKHILYFVVIIAAIVMSSNNMSWSLVDCIGGIILGCLGVRICFSIINSTKKKKAMALNAKREEKYREDIKRLEAQQKYEIESLPKRMNATANDYRRRYQQNGACRFLTDWLLHVFGEFVQRADRSEWLPQVVMNMDFCVVAMRIMVNGNYQHCYDMRRMGMAIDDNMLSNAALAYVLEQMFVAEARKRYAVDPNGNRTVIRSSRDDSTVSISYSAPNSGV